jgi:hypothetical protein
VIRSSGFSVVQCRFLIAGARRSIRPRLMTRIVQAPSGNLKTLRFHRRLAIAAASGRAAWRSESVVPSATVGSELRLQATSETVVAAGNERPRASEVCIRSCPYVRLHRRRFDLIDRPAGAVC